MAKAHYSSCDRGDWMTSLRILNATRKFQAIALDPCAADDPANWFATYNINGNGKHALPGPPPAPVSGLALDWCATTVGRGCVFMNPPYGGRTGVIDVWIAKAAMEAERGCEVVGLVPTSTGSQWFMHVWRTASRVCFVEGREQFRVPGTVVGRPQLRLFEEGEDAIAVADGGSDTAPFWSAMPYWGSYVERFDETFSHVGQVVQPSIRRL